MFNFPPIQCRALNYCNSPYDSHLYSESVVIEISMKSQRFINQIGIGLEQWIQSSPGGKIM